jgi:predicted GTPase
MPTFRWIVDNKDYDKIRLNRASPYTWRQYFGGINKINRKPMYKDELQDLENVYKHTLHNIQAQERNVMPSLLHYLKEFLELHEQKEAVNEKLDVLLQKLGRKETEEIDGGNDECCRED